MSIDLIALYFGVMKVLVTVLAAGLVVVWVEGVRTDRLIGKAMNQRVTAEDVSISAAIGILTLCAAALVAAFVIAAPW